jgi:hypothetical protein
MEGNMFCSKCGKEVSSEERFCLRCGSHEKRQKPLKHGNDNTQGTPFILIDRNGWYYLVENRLRGPFSGRSMRKKFIDGFLDGLGEMKIFKKCRRSQNSARVNFPKLSI